MSPPAAERPRDRLGRPLPRGAAGFPPAPPRTDISADDAAAEARAYLAEGLPFHAHEVLEMRWRCCPDDERELWRALAQAAAGATHAARGNPVGEQRLMTRAAAAIEAYAGPNPVDITQLLADLGLGSPG
ncbi:MAG: DUF309 domain-containing protein [Actinomycetota bacterium]